MRCGSGGGCADGEIVEATREAHAVKRDFKRGLPILSPAFVAAFSTIKSRYSTKRAA